ncbi:MAG: 2Fe-2S iron-sulfur cluster binding domain-containing protein, partial [candidate division Zixibacteria bacterium]|nr:2Fe-2S iron-sulfur cluster binding domain-containing protein [candidate division Zixibacteria bacterium]
MTTSQKKKRGDAKRVKNLFEVLYLPDEKKAKVERGVSLLEATGVSGVHINNLCGGQGVCGKCKVKVRKGRVEGRSKYLSILSKEEL